MSSYQNIPALAAPRSQRPIMLLTTCQHCGPGFQFIRTARDIRPTCCGKLLEIVDKDKNPVVVDRV